MRENKDNIVDCITKDAWEDNWDDVGIEKALEIFNYPRVKKQLELYKSYLPKDAEILEGGCGVGSYLIHLNHLGFNVVGIDYNFRPLLKIAQYDKGLRICCGDVSNLPFSDCRFGAYLSLGVIEHFTEGPKSAIQEACRVLSGRGYFIVQVPRLSIFHKIKYPLVLLKRSAKLRKIFRKPPRAYYWEQYFKVSELNNLLDNSGFDVLKINPVDHEHSLLSFSPLFRDKNSFDGANRLGVILGEICSRVFPWITASGMIFICRKK
jgi:SAM-dependent methyltransferase